MRPAIIAAITILGLSVTSQVVLAEQPASPAAPAAVKMTTDETPLGDLLDNAAAKAVLNKHAPTLTEPGPIEQARPMTLKALQQYMPTLTDELLAKIDADLALIK